MSHDFSKDERARDEANRDYFVTLANSRFSVSRLPLMAFMTAVGLGLGLILWASVIFYHGHEKLLPVFVLHLVVIGISLLIWVLTAFRWWVYRYQVLSASLMWGFSVVGWVYAWCFNAVGIAATVDDPSGGDMVDTTRMSVFAIVGFAYVCGAAVVHVLLLRKRLREGHSIERTLGNLGAVPKVFRRKSLWIIFAVVVIGPNVLTLGKYAYLTVGVVMFLLFASVLPSLPVEFAYLVYLKSRDRTYWEKRPPKRVIKRAKVVRVLWKTDMWIVIVLAFCVAVEILGRVLATD